MKFESIINSISHFTSSEEDILAYILNHKEKINDMSSSDLARETYTSPATITRLSQKLGVSGFSELKYLIQEDIKTNDKLNNSPNNIELLKEDINETVNNIDKDEILKIVDLILNSNRIYTYGTSWGERNALEMFSRNFMAMNTYFVNIPSLTEFKWSADEINKTDLVFIISFSGENSKVNPIVNNLKIRGVPVVSITPMHKNSLAEMSSINLYYKVTELTEAKQTKSKEHNLFTTLHILLDIVYRCFLDILNKE